VAAQGYLSFPATTYLIPSGDAEGAWTGNWTQAENYAPCESGVDGSSLMDGANSFYSYCPFIYPSGVQNQMWANIRILDGISSVQLANINLAKTYYGTPVAPTPKTIDMTLYGAPARTFKVALRVYNNSTGWWSENVSSTFSALSTLTLRYGMGLSATTNPIAFFDEVRVDTYFYEWKQSSHTAHYTSEIYNTGYSTTIAGVFSSTIVVPSSTGINFIIRESTSPNNDVWSGWQTIADKEVPDIDEQYWQVKSTFTTSIATATPYLQTVYLNAKTTGYFISQCHATGSNITSWDRFQCTILPNSGDMTFWISTGTTCNMVTRTSSTWQSQTNYTPIAVPTASYIAYRTLFDLDHTTENPTLRDCTISWNEGTNPPPLASSVYRDRYYLAYTSGTVSTDTNDHILVLDRGDRWTIFDSHPCYSLNLYERNLYCGDSTATGFIYQLDSGDTDSGTAFTSRIVTKAFDFGFPEANKLFNDIYLDFGPAEDSAGSSTMSVYYLVDRGTTTYSLGTLNLYDDPGHMPSSYFPFPVGQINHARYLQIQVETDGPQQWKLFGGKLFFDLLRRK